MPSAQRDLGFSNDNRQWVVTGYALAFGSLLLVGGRLSDYFGRKRMFLIGVAGFAIASAIGGAAGGFTTLLIARIAQGAFGAMLAPAALSLLSVTFPDSAPDRGRAFGIFGAISGAGGALGLLLGGMLTQGLSWRWCLYVNIAIAAVAFGGGVVFLCHGNRPTRVPPDIGGAVTAVLGLVAIVYGLGNAESHGWHDVTTVGSVLGGVIFLGVFVLIESRVEHPLLPLSVVIDRVRGTAYLTLAIAGIGMFGVFLFLTYYLQETLGFTPLQCGTAFLPMIAMVMVGAVVSGGVLLPRTGLKPLVPAGCLLAAVGMVMLTGIASDSSYVANVLPALLVTGIGFGCIFGPIQNAATSGVGTRDAGVASAMVNTAQQIGGSIGLAAFSSLSAIAINNHLTVMTAAAEAAIAGYHLVFWVTAAVFVCAVASAAILFPRRTLTTTSHPAG